MTGYNAGTINTYGLPQTVRQGDHSSYVEHRTIIQGEGSTYAKGNITMHRRPSDQSPELKVLETLTAKLVSTSTVDDKMYITVIEEGKAPRVITIGEGECVIINGTKYMHSISGNQTFNFSF